MQYIDGNLVTMAKKGQFDVIVHGCNCFCNMGAGIAKEIKHVFPGAYAVDCATKEGDRSKLGTCTVYSDSPTKCDIVNAYTQYRYGRGPQLDYDALRSCMRWLKKEYSGRRIGLPKIGAGHAHGVWSCIEKIIKEELRGEDVTIVLLN